jgi:nicotinate phosphoribosyltransferase
MTESEAEPLRSLLFTDLYQLTMAQAYLAEGMQEPGVFELFFRTLPPQRNYIVAAGLDDVLNALEKLQISDAELDYLRSLRLFSGPLLDWLRSFRFTGDVYAVPEGTVVFANEPLVQIVAPLAEAQLVETLILNQYHLQSVVASKAARLVTAAAPREVVDFGSRRAHGSDAAMKVARVSWLAGAAGTSNVLAGCRYGIPVYGTMAHSYIQAHDDELAAFAAFALEFPETTLLVDTYDTLVGVRKVIELSRRLGAKFRVKSIRLDSGDLADLASQSRQMLDEAGLSGVKIFASSELDEYRIAAMVRAGVPIDAFGVGTRLAVSQDAPDLDLAYKLVEYAGRPRVKLSSHKVLYPGAKQVFRSDREGEFSSDVLGRSDERLPGEPLLAPVMRGGNRLPAGSVALAASRALCRQQLGLLHESLRRFEAAETPYPVEVSSALEHDLAEFRRSHQARANPATP